MCGGGGWGRDGEGGGCVWRMGRNLHYILKCWSLQVKCREYAAAQLLRNQREIAGGTSRIVLQGR